MVGVWGIEGCVGGLRGRFRSLGVYPGASWARVDGMLEYTDQGLVGRKWQALEMMED